MLYTDMIFSFFSVHAGSWVHYNDARVSLCTELEVLKSQAYILLYTRSNGRTAQSNLGSNFTVPKSP